MLGWNRVRQLDEELSLPLIRATLSEAIQAGESKSVPLAAAADILFSVYCNAVLFIAAGHEPDQAADDAEAVIFTLLSVMRAESNRQAVEHVEISDRPTTGLVS